MGKSAAGEGVSGPDWDLVTTALWEAIDGLPASPGTSVTFTPANAVPPFRTGSYLSVRYGEDTDQAHLMVEHPHDPKAGRHGTWRLYDPSSGGPGRDGYPDATPVPREAARLATILVAAHQGIVHDATEFARKFAAAGTGPRIDVADERGIQLTLDVSGGQAVFEGTGSVWYLVRGPSGTTTPAPLDHEDDKGRGFLIRDPDIYSMLAGHLETASETRAAGTEPRSRARDGLTFPSISFGAGLASLATSATRRTGGGRHAPARFYRSADWAPRR